MRAAAWGLVLALAVLWVPAGQAHQNNCVVALHVGPVATHQGCTTDPHTCTSDVFVGTTVGGFYIAFVCTEPHQQLCAVKATLGPAGHYRVCVKHPPG